MNNDAGMTVVVRPDGILEVSRAPYVRDELERRAQPILGKARRNAPVSKTGSHGRPAGYLRSRVRTRHGLDTYGWWVDVVSDATSPDGFPYGKVMDRRRPYLRPSLPR